MKKLFAILWNIISVILLLALKIISIILIIPIYVIMLLLTLFSPITYLISFLCGVLYILIIIMGFYNGNFAQYPLTFIFLMIILAIPLIICGSCTFFGAEAAAGLIGFLGSIVSLPFNCLFIRFSKPQVDWNEYDYYEKK